jgi:hypothetical protein
MNISDVIRQLAAFHELYGDLPVYHVMGQTYTPLPQLPWLASPVGQVPGPSNYIVVFGSPVTITPPS